MRDDEPIPTPETWLGPILHAAYDPVVRDPIPKELLVASGAGAAGWEELREWWATGEDRP